MLWSTFDHSTTLHPHGDGRRSSILLLDNGCLSRNTQEHSSDGGGNWEGEVAHVVWPTDSVEIARGNPVTWTVEQLPYSNPN